MNPTGKIASIAYALLLISCAGLAGFEVFGWAFAIGDSDGKISHLTGAFLIGSSLAAAGLLIMAFVSWTRWWAVSLIAMVSALFVLPIAAFFCWQQAPAMWLNAQSGGGHNETLDWVIVILPVPLDLLAIWLSWGRLRSAISRGPRTLDADRPTP
jgi:hypothetical protein